MRWLAALLVVIPCYALGQTHDQPKFTDKLRIWTLSGFYSVTRESMAVREVGSTTGPFLMAERRIHSYAGPGGPTTAIRREWIDGRVCPELELVYQALPKRWSPESPSRPTPFHGMHARLAVISNDGRKAVHADYEGPVADWRRQAEISLKRCWGNYGYARRDQLPLTLETDKDEEDFFALDHVP